MNIVLGIFLAGGAGCLCRYGLSLLLPGSLWANILGSLAMGWLLARGHTHVAWQNPIFTAGFLGGFTTFSALQAELWTAILQDNFWQAIGHAAISLLLGLAAIAAGYRLGNGTLF